MAESSYNLKLILVKEKEENAKAGLKVNNKKTKTLTTEELYKLNVDM